jgi:hypothetical protein
MNPYDISPLDTGAVDLIEDEDFYLPTQEQVEEMWREAMKEENSQ